MCWNCWRWRCRMPFWLSSHWCFWWSLQVFCFFLSITWPPKFLYLTSNRVKVYCNWFEFYVVMNYQLLNLFLWLLWVPLFLWQLTAVDGDASLPNPIVIDSWNCFGIICIIILTRVLIPAWDAELPTIWCEHRLSWTTLALYGPAGSTAEAGWLALVGWSAVLPTQPASQ